MTEITVRDFTGKDLATTARLFFASIREGAAGHYSDEQRQAWAPAVPDADDWRRRLEGLKTWVAEADGTVAGFMSVSPAGHIDLAFVHPGRIGTGVAGHLYGYVEKYALERRIPALTSDASLLARPFFERRGWRVIAEQHPVRNGVALTNFRMEKKLH